ncbi:MAG: ATP-binding protein [Actinomycetota bacterium]
MKTVWESVTGQDAAIARLRSLAQRTTHAYLFVGPDGAGKEVAARAFAARLVSGSDDASSRVADLVMRGGFVDVTEIVREGAAIDNEEAQAIVQASVLTPTEADMRVVIVHEVHLMRDMTAARLLKTFEEPNDQLVFILLTEQLLPALETIASRCVVVHFPALDQGVIADQLRTEGIDVEVARRAARSAGGSLARARILATDHALAERQAAFAAVPYQLDGSGAAVAKAVESVSSLIERAAEPLLSQQEAELEALEDRVKMVGERGSGRRALADMHKRQLRKFKTEELREGLTLIAAEYHKVVVSLQDGVDPAIYARAVHDVNDAISSMSLNVNESLMLHGLFARCPSLTMIAGRRDLIEA